jgi:chromosome segregation ATPase
MDEYDVFLDESSRAKTLQMLQDYALKPEQANRQFIIITPHNLKGVTTSSQDTKIQKLQAPERGSIAHGLQQATLNF